VSNFYIFEPWGSYYCVLKDWSNYELDGTGVILPVEYYCGECVGIGSVAIAES
jgi:hypothetical protein